MILHSIAPLCVLGAALVLLPTGSRADDSSVPTAGLLYNTTETSSLTYQCTLTKPDMLTCDFTQTSIRRKAQPDQLDAQLKSAHEEFQKGVKPRPGECASMKDILDVVQGRKVAPKPEGLARLSAMEKADLVAFARGMETYCAEPTEEHYLSMVRLNHQKEVRSCTVSSNAFTQTFTRVRDLQSESEPWVNQTQPNGPCGVVQLNRFEYEPQQDSKFGFWKYIARKAVTNPKGEFFPGASCAGLDEAAYLYDWRSKQHALECDYVEFSAI